MKLIDIAIRRRVTISMFTIAILIFGIVSLSRLEINLLPDLSYPSLTIRTEYPGAAPAEIENLITKPIEETVGVVKNVRQVSSVSRSGQSDVILEFAWGTDMDQSRIELREKMDEAGLPLEVTRPIILRFDPSLDPVLRFALFRKTTPSNLSDSQSIQQASNPDPGSPEDMGIETLKYVRRFAEQQLKKELESTIGVAAVKVSGGLEDEIQVYVDQAKLAQLQIPVESVSAILARENVNLSGGRLEEGTQQFLVRTLNEFHSLKEMEDVIVARREGRTIYLKDIAAVNHGYKEREAITRMDGVEAIEIAIYKEGDANPVSTARAVEERLAGIRAYLPDDMQIVKVYDQSTFINNAINEVIQAAVIGGILAMLVLFLFLRNFWATVIVSLSIPISVITTFNLMYGGNLSLNMMSLGGIALGIGLLVDNSIVVLENISRHREKGKAAKSAAFDGASEVATAVIASTLTTIAVFFPLVFVKGIAGQLFGEQALTVTFALLASLLVALTLIPMLAAMDKKSVDDEPVSLPVSRTKIGKKLNKGRIALTYSLPVLIVRIVRSIVSFFAAIAAFVFLPLANGFNYFFVKIERRYPRWIERALDRKALVIATALGLFLFSLVLIPGLGVELIPELTQGEFAVEFKLPPGTPIEKTDQVISGIQQAATGLPRIRTTFSVAGTGNRFDANPDEGGENWGEMTVMMAGATDQGRQSAAMADLRTRLERIPGLQYKFATPTLFSFKTPVEVQIYGYDLKRLKQISSAISTKMSSSSRFTDIKSTMESGHPEVQIYIDRERASLLGVSPYEVAQRLVTKVRGEVASRYSLYDRKIDILVRSRAEDRSSIEKLRSLIVNPGSEHPVPLQALARIVVEEGPSEIRRIGQERVGLVTANLNFGDLGSAVEELDGIIAETSVPVGLSIRQGGQNEEVNVSFQSLQFALILAIFLVYLVMASQFESLMHPFVILVTIPLALIGAVLALWITASTISVVVLIGVILLAGIVVNNAIVLIDLINQLRASGMEKRQAIIEAGGSRLRPIMMTTLTTTLGLLPLALGFGEGAEVRAPMAITVIGGLLVSTLLTLIVIPVVYSILDRKSGEQLATARQSISPE